MRFKSKSRILFVAMAVAFASVGSSTRNSFASESSAWRWVYVFSGVSQVTTWQGYAYGFVSDKSNERSIFSFQSDGRKVDPFNIEVQFERDGNISALFKKPNTDSESIKMMGGYFKADIGDTKIMEHIWLQGADYSYLLMVRTRPQSLLSS